MELAEFLTLLAEQPQSVSFEQTMAVIDTGYNFMPTAFDNGDTRNEAGQNNGSCKILSFGQLNKLSEAQTLACFGKFYREDVLGHPDADDHQNIRNFMKTGWAGVKFENQALTQK